MGTNFYARIIPTKERKDKLISLIKDDKFGDVVDEAVGMYGEYDAEYASGGEGLVHLGKRSAGWKFLWNANVLLHDDENNPFLYKKRLLYQLTKKGIRDFLSRENVYVVSEYHESDPLEELKRISSDDKLRDDEEVYDFKHIDEFLDMTKDENRKWRDQEPWDGVSYHQYEVDMYNKIQRGDTDGMTEFEIKNFDRYPIVYKDSWEKYIKQFVLSEYPEAIFTGMGEFYNDGLRFCTCPKFG